MYQCMLCRNDSLSVYESSLNGAKTGRNVFKLSPSYCNMAVRNCNKWRLQHIWACEIPTTQHCTICFNMCAWIHHGKCYRFYLISSEIQRRHVRGTCSDFKVEFIEDWQLLSSTLLQLPCLYSKLAPAYVNKNMYEKWELKRIIIHSK